jgi:uncharacterized DUF497 family protein
MPGALNANRTDALRALLSRHSAQINITQINNHILILLNKPYFMYSKFMSRIRFEWDEKKDKENRTKHNISFSLAQHAFLDSNRVIVEDVSHKSEEERFYCIGRVGDGIVTVRFTYRGNVIRIYGAGYWRKGRKIYEDQNKIR